MVLLIAVTNAYSQSQVANFSTGKPGTKSYESFSFYVQDETRGEITYRYGKNRRELNLNYVGRETLGGKAIFSVEFPNGQIYKIIPFKTYLKVISEKGNYSKLFRWEYEGPVNGIGTWCDSCTQDDKESVALLKKYYF